MKPCRNGDCTLKLDERWMTGYLRVQVTADLSKLGKACSEMHVVVSEEDSPMVQCGNDECNVCSIEKRNRRLLVNQRKNYLTGAVEGL